MLYHQRDNAKFYRSIGRKLRRAAKSNDYITVKHLYARLTNHLSCRGIEPSECGQLLGVMETILFVYPDSPGTRLKETFKPINAHKVR